ncbi:M48 family metallopeptidase [Rheinheimera sp. MMS21-TC3]|uniref:M48 family metallopeptidase n=1 Tax=Rheinheimera sp. MMS21-TC3 TaxID=3072790 RepID=UPI0028C4BD9F|nr:M48 family metallopeptidase [Rheinheimera sp. MMS21-TC3]WNO60366.1 M48 family metallopeptidase [Rheinheimera sp. MMS21-TC3]
MSSNFFAQQDLARRNTRLLIVLFALAVLLLVTLTNAVVLFSLGFIDTSTLDDQYGSDPLPWSIIAWISFFVIGAVSIAILLKWHKLRHGGKAVAESLGGVRLTPDSTEPLQRRLLNVVEEMALAANLPVPPVYLLPESGINAFAAGYSPADAVIGITQGALEQLNRDELQGVIGHEFSHVLNGDMRMNIRLIAILNGILFIGHVGYFLMRSGSASSINRSRSSNNKNNGGGILALALGFIVIGYLGSFIGNLIKAAVSRQREYLADASAVQFSRNPRGIAGALKVIGSHSSKSIIRSENASENSHLFFGEAISSWLSIFATHPPLAKRIQRLDPHWNGKYPTPRNKEQQIAEANAQLAGDNSSATPQSVQEKLMAALPLLLLHSTRQSQPASALVCCLLLQSDPEIRQAQLSLIKQIGSNELLQQVDQLCDQVEKLDLLQQVQLLQRVIPALKTLSLNEFTELNQLLKSLQQQLPQQNLSSWLTYQFIQHTVAVEFDKKQIVRKFTRQNITELEPSILMLLALISQAAGDNDAEQATAWQHALLSLELADTKARPNIDWSQLSAALPQFLALAPNDKQRLWQAIQAAVNADNQLTTQEQALLHALALLLEMPYNSNEI